MMVLIGEDELLLFEFDEWFDVVFVQWLIIVSCDGILILGMVEVDDCCWIFVLEMVW